MLKRLYVHKPFLRICQVRERPDADQAEEGEVHAHPHRHRRRLPRLPLLQADGLRESYCFLS